MISLCHTPSTGTWIGSTPEIILSGHEKDWHTVALAGTMPMQGEVMPTEWSKKNKEEQAFVGDYIRKAIKKFGSKITEKGPYTARAGQLVHLKTDFHFCLKDTAHLGDVLQELHPTPAVCGLPKEEAYQFILQTEPHNRLFYSGVIGWIDPEGDTTLYVNLRCMHIEGKTLRYMPEEVSFLNPQLIPNGKKRSKNEYHAKYPVNLTYLKIMYTDKKIYFSL